MTTGGEVLIKILAAYGIDTVFGIPGTHTVELYRGLPHTAIRHVTPRHEQGAGFMADWLRPHDSKACRMYYRFWSGGLQYRHGNGAGPTGLGTNAGYLG